MNSEEEEDTQTLIKNYWTEVIESNRENFLTGDLKEAFLS
jgi:hypothetical protein